MTSWRVKDQLREARLPMVMGIINATPDSFHAPSRIGVDDALRVAERMLKDGAAIIDIGGMSTRPGAEDVSVEEELRRLLPVIDSMHRRFPEALLSADTFRASVAEQAVAAGASLVNDISAGTLDEDMLPTVAKLKVPYIAMHMQGTPRTMQVDPKYTDVVAEVTLHLSRRLNAARAAGIADVIVDPGFGFGKTTAHNYEVLNRLGSVAALGAPLLVGLSRKRMINEVLATTAAEALNGTTALNTIALLKGASILRVHDVKEAVQCVKLVAALRDQK
jgi:dihydropteroate synthase